jgi:hypothetical protein
VLSCHSPSLIRYSHPGTGVTPMVLLVV